MGQFPFLLKKHTLSGNSIMKKHILIGDSEGCLNTYIIKDPDYN